MGCCNGHHLIFKNTSMKKTEFIQLLKEALELTDLNIKETTILKDLSNYDSMSVMAIIALVDEHFSKRLTAKELGTISSVKSLIELIGIDRFTD
ncbi:MAG: acyl carrier protein [Alphaproteobacteria bacterium]|nr:acyl carrier protein [Alphaproteobacteria bacterium]